MNSETTPIVCTRCKLRMNAAADDRCLCGKPLEPQQSATSARRISTTSVNSAAELVEPISALEACLIEERDRLDGARAIHAAKATMTAAAALEAIQVMRDRGLALIDRLRSPRVGDERVQDMKDALEWRRSVGEYLSDRKGSR